ncbi:MAG: DUF6382 domain-containing protein [Lachnospiraceae bacterium]|nr:DUF6382 domain-containing protein [Lachnospiraceae bacterium]
MKTEYKRDLANNYLVIEPEGGINTEDYILHMAEKNEIPGLIPFQIRKINGKSNLYYEITSKITMDSAYEKKTMQYEDILRVLSEIREIQESVRRYLLNPRQMVFDPCYLYMDAETYALSVCYLPMDGYQEECSVKILAEFILKKLDHEDRRAVSLGYSFYQRAAEPNFSLPEMLHEMLKNNCRAGKNFISNPSVQEEKQQDMEELWNHMNKGRIGSRQGFDEEARQEYGDFGEKYERNFNSFHELNRNPDLPERLFGIIHPAILLVTILMLAVTAGLFYLNFIDLTQTGGIACLILAAAGLGHRVWSGKRKNQKRMKEKWNDENAGYEEKQEEVKSLQEEMYQRDALHCSLKGCEEWETGKEQKMRKEPERNRIMNSESEVYDGRKGEIDDTQYLAAGHVGGKLCLVNEWSEEYPVIQMGERAVIVGKLKGQADILLNAAAVSRIHAKLENFQGKYYVRDLNSKNGTYVNGERLNAQEKRELRAGDKVEFANISYQVVRITEKTDETRLLF